MEIVQHELKLQLNCLNITAKLAKEKENHNTYFNPNHISAILTIQGDQDDVDKFAKDLQYYMDSLKREEISVRAQCDIMTHHLLQDAKIIDNKLKAITYRYPGIAFSSSVLERDSNISYLKFFVLYSSEKKIRSLKDKG